MKKTKLLFIISLLTAFAFTSCQKEKNPEPKKSTQVPTSARFSKEVTIYDSTKTFSVSYRVEANQSDVVESMVQSLKTASIKVKDESDISQHQSTSKPGPDQEEMHKLLSQADSNKTAVKLVEIARNIGVHKGYSLRLSESDNARLNGTIVTAYFMITIQAWCDRFIVRNMWLNPCYAHFHVAPGVDFQDWIFDESATLATGDYHITTMGYYAPRQMVIIPTVVNGNWSINNRIEYEVW